jgi:uncharacterized protein (TIGR02391 family)
MNIQSQLSERVWHAIQSSYENRNYTAAIMDAVYFLSDLIRERSGLDSDGVSLAGQAFGGTSPKLKINKLETESEKNIQSGIASMLRGMYQAIRNPRSHEKHSDSQNDADAIILFTDYLVKIIDQAKTPFTTADFLDRVFDSDFVASERYGGLLVKHIPPKKRMEVFVEVFRSKEKGDCKKLPHFFNAILSVMTDDEKQQAFSVVEKELSWTTDAATIRTIIKVLPPDCFDTFEEAVRLRIENKLIKSVQEGEYNTRKQKCEHGAFGSWITTLSGHLLLEGELVRVVVHKLAAGTDAEKDYVFQFLFTFLSKLMPEPTAYVTSTIKAGLAAGDRRFRDALCSIINDGPEKWQESFKKAYEEFKESEVSVPPDGGEDIPF